MQRKMLFAGLFALVFVVMMISLVILEPDKVAATGVPYLVCQPGMIHIDGYGNFPVKEVAEALSKQDCENQCDAEGGVIVLWGETDCQYNFGTHLWQCHTQACCDPA